MKRASPKRWLQIGLSVVLLALVFFLVDLPATFAELRSADLRWLIAGFGATVLSRFVMGYKWNLLMRAKGILLPHLEVIRIYYVAGFLGLLLPATVGADVIRAMLVRGKDRPFPDIVSSIIVERLLGLVMISFAALAGGLTIAGVLLESDVPLGVLLGVPGLLLLVSLGAIVFSVTHSARALVERVATWLETHGRLSGLGRPLRKLYDSYWGYRFHRSTLFSFCALTLLEILTLVVWNFTAARALGLDIGLFEISLIVPVFTLLVRLPISVAGLGVVEGSWVFFLGMLGVPGEQALAAGLVAHALGTIALLPGGLLYGLVPRYRAEAREAVRQDPTTTDDHHPAEV